jgi:hypothetical protein
MPSGSDGACRGLRLGRCSRPICFCGHNAFLSGPCNSIPLAGIPFLDSKTHHCTPFSAARHLALVRAHSKARANRAKSGSVNFSPRLSRRTAIMKSERRGCRSPLSDATGRSPVPDGTGRSFDTAIEHGTVAMMARGKTRTHQPAGGPRLLARSGRKGRTPSACQNKSSWSLP